MAESKEREFQQAFKLASTGDSTAQNNLGIMYLYGEGVTKDDFQAVEWFRRSEWGQVSPIHSA